MRNRRVRIKEDEDQGAPEGSLEAQKVVKGRTLTKLSRFASTLLGYLLRFCRFMMRYIFQPRLNTKAELYPCHEIGEFEPRSRFGFRFFLVSNRIHNIGFGFEYNGVYYFSNGHFSAHENKLEIDGEEIRLYQQGFTLLTSRKHHNLKRPVDDEELFLLNPYMPTIKGRCVYKHPFYYSYFPIFPEHKEFTGLPIVNGRGELVSIYDNFKRIDRMVYNILGETRLWEDFGAACNFHVEILDAKEPRLRVFKILSVYGNCEEPSFQCEIGHFFEYDSILYISRAFVDDSGTLSLPFSFSNYDEKEVQFSRLQRDTWISALDSRHNMGFPTNGEEVHVLNVKENEEGIKGMVRLDKNYRYWADFRGVPDKGSVGLPILDKRGEVIGVYSEFKILRKLTKACYSILLGDPNTFKLHFIKLCLESPSSNILKIYYDKYILEKLVSLCVGKNGDDQLLSRVIFSVGAEEILRRIYKDLVEILQQLNGLSNQELIATADNSTEYSQIQNQRLIIASTNWVGYSFLNSNNSFPFNSSKSLLIIFPHASTFLTEELLNSYYMNSPKKTRGSLLKFQLCD
ncbi:putative transmembrane domain near N [Cryptosporidium felis]|nr:putative transmembrane domain near N [Cryptosporidium felis]